MLTSGTNIILLYVTIGFLLISSWSAESEWSATHVVFLFQGICLFVVGTIWDGAKENSVGLLCVLLLPVYISLSSSGFEGRKAGILAIMSLGSFVGFATACLAPSDATCGTSRSCLALQSVVLALGVMEASEKGGDDQERISRAVFCIYSVCVLLVGVCVSTSASCEGSLSDETWGGIVDSLRFLSIFASSGLFEITVSE